MHWPSESAGPHSQRATPSRLAAHTLPCARAAQPLQRSSQISHGGVVASVVCRHAFAPTSERGNGSAHAQQLAESTASTQSASPWHSSANRQLPSAACSRIREGGRRASHETARGQAPGDAWMHALTSASSRFEAGYATRQGFFRSSAALTAIGSSQQPTRTATVHSSLVAPAAPPPAAPSRPPEPPTPLDPNPPCSEAPWPAAASKRPPRAPSPADAAEPAAADSGTDCVVRPQAAATSAAARSQDLNQLNRRIPIMPGLSKTV